MPRGNDEEDEDVEEEEGGWGALPAKVTQLDQKANTRGSERVREQRKEGAGTRNTVFDT